MLHTNEQEELKKYLVYYPDTGIFYRIGTLSRNYKEPKICDCIDNGYVVITFQKKPMKAHKLAFLYMTGAIPDVVDHIDGDGLNNRWDNIRAVTQAQNNHNRRIDKSNTTGIKGVSWYDNKKMGVGYLARISINYKRISCWFSIIEYKDKQNALDKAIAWVKEKREEYHGDYANHG
jgi:hypothetical protein